MSGGTFVAEPKHDFTEEALKASSDSFERQHSVSSNAVQSDLYEFANNLSVMVSKLHECGDAGSHSDANYVVIVLAAEADMKLERESLNVTFHEDAVEVEERVIGNVELVIAISKCSHAADPTDTV